MNFIFMISKILSILFFICLPSLLINGDENSQEGRFDGMIRKLCSKENLMLKSGSSNEAASRTMSYKIKKFIDNITRDHYWDPVQHIGVRRGAEVGKHGQLLDSNTIASQQAVITNTKALIIDQVNNDIKNSQVSQFQLNSRPTISTRENVKNRSKVPSTQYTDESVCHREVENEIRMALMQSNRLKPKMSFYRRNREFSDENDPIELSKYREKMFRQGNSNAEKVAAVSIQEKTSIGKYGYDVDLDQIATGDSANSLSSLIVDEQSHSNYRSSKISAVRLAASFNTV